MSTNNAVNTTLAGQTGTVNFVGSTSPTLTTPKISAINDVNSNTIMSLIPAGSAVNYPYFINSSTGNPVEIGAAGTDSNIGMVYRAKATGIHAFVSTHATAPFEIFNGTLSQHSTTFAFANTSQNRTVTFPDSDGTVAFVASSGGLKSFQVFTSGSSQTYTRPAGITSILVEVIGGGGAGGGATSADGSHVGIGGGGGAGGYARLYIASAASTYTYTVGAGGTAGSSGANPGNAGATTTFGASLQATAGAGGGGGASTANTAAATTIGGAGGVGSSGTVNSQGQPGGGGITALGVALSGIGGNSVYGGGGIGAIANGAGNAAGAYGAGGSGGVAINGSVVGGVGNAGLIIVWEFA